MTRTHRQLAAILVLICAGGASLGTTQAGPGSTSETKDHVDFGAGVNVVVRHVHIAVVPSPVAAGVSVEIPIYTGGVNGQEPVALTVIRERDQKSVLQQPSCGGETPPGCTEIVGTDSNTAGWFEVFASCAAGTACADDFTKSSSNAVVRK